MKKLFVYYRVSTQQQKEKKISKFKKEKSKNILKKIMTKLVIYGHLLIDFQSLL